MFSDRIEVSVNYLNQPLILKSHQTFLLIKMPTMDLPTPLKPFYSKKSSALTAALSNKEVMRKKKHIWCAIVIYNPPINFRIMLLATLHYMEQITKQLSC